MYAELPMTRAMRLPWVTVTGLVVWRTTVRSEVAVPSALVALTLMMLLPSTRGTVCSMRISEPSLVTALMPRYI